jgi:hypothetical protein
MELTSELHKALAAAWAAFTMGMLIFHAYRHCPHGWLLSRLLLFLSPAILSGYGIHSVQVCERILAAKQGETVDDRIYLASVTRADLGDGYDITVERYSDGTAKFVGQMPTTVGRNEGGNGGLQSGDEEIWNMPRGMVPLSVRNRPKASGDWVDSERL